MRPSLQKDLLFRQMGNLTRSYETDEPEKLLKALCGSLSTLNTNPGIVMNLYWESAIDSSRVFIDIVWIQ